MKETIEKVYQDDFNWMQRESKGLYPWVNTNSWRLSERISHVKCDHPFCNRHSGNAPGLITLLLSSQFMINPILDIFLKALIRAEIRFISRYILQRSNEERLTGNIVSEIDAAVHLSRPVVKRVSIDRYQAEKQIDFFYYDLSRGGSVEKQTGADLGFIIVVDLPDYPFTVKSVVFQAKKCDPHAQVDVTQYKTIRSVSENGSAYLFYDMDFRTLASPMVVASGHTALTSRAEESGKKGTKSFSMPKDEIFKSGVPLSLFIMHDVLERSIYGEVHQSFVSAFHKFQDLSATKNLAEPFNGRLAIVSVGKNITLSTNNDGGLIVTV